MLLNKENLEKIAPLTQAQLPSAGSFDLPEKVLQFGTGVLLRALPDCIIDQANRQGVFNGRIVVVKSTAGDISDFSKQDSLYTVSVRGYRGPDFLEQDVVCSSISRVLSAVEDWQLILKAAESPDLRIVISNTTEVGIRFEEENLRQGTPQSFPGRLLAILLARYNAFDGDPSKGLVILPTELLTDNATYLKSILLKLAAFNELEEEFVDWLSTANTFCNTLVDRIVPGKPVPAALKELESSLGYTDELLTVAEVYELWAIEGPEYLSEVLSFCKTDPAVVITPDIQKYRELKLRLLNATHTLSCALSILAGFETVDQAMEDENFLQYLTYMMNEEIAPAIPYPISAGEKAKFAANVVARFRNPYLKHKWTSISLNYTAKLNNRVVPLIQQYQQVFGHLPDAMCMGIAAYVLYSIDGSASDPAASTIRSLWDETGSYSDLLTQLFEDQSLWEVDLTCLQGFTEKVLEYIRAIEEGGVLNIVKRLLNSKIQSQA